MSTCELRDDWLVCTLQGMKPASEEAKQQHSKGFYMCQGEQVHSVADPEQYYFHGSSPENGLQILIDKEFQVLQEHRPTGIYSYASDVLSGQSCYTAQGMEFCFTSVGIVLSLQVSKRASQFGEEVPPGFIFRLKRSEAKRSGSAGLEHVHHPNNTEIISCRIALPAFQKILEKHQLPAFAPTLSCPSTAMAWKQDNQWDKSSQQDKWGKAVWKQDNQGSQDWKKQKTDDLPAAWIAVADATPGGSSSSGGDFSAAADAVCAAVGKLIAVATAQAMQPSQALVVSGSQTHAPAMVPPAGNPPVPAQPGWTPPGNWPAVGQHYYGPGVSVDPKLLHQAVLKVMVLGSLGLSLRKLRFCWKCYSCSWFSGGSSCANPGCMLFSFREPAAALEMASMDPEMAQLYCAVTATLVSLITPGNANPLSITNLDMDQFVWAKLCMPGDIEAEEEVENADGTEAKGEVKGMGKGKGKPQDDAKLPKAKAAGKAKGKGKAKGVGKAPVPVPKQAVIPGAHAKAAPKAGAKAKAPAPKAPVQVPAVPAVPAVPPAV